MQYEIFCLGSVTQREWRARVSVQVLRDGGGGHGLQGHAHEAESQAEENCCQENRVARGKYCMSKKS